MKWLVVILFASVAGALAQVAFSSRHVETHLTRSAWYDANWAYRIPVTITTANTVTNYAVKLNLTSVNFGFANALSDGSDLRVTDYNGTELIPYYIRSYDNVGETAEVWVKPTLLSSSVNSTIWLYYGNATPSTFLLPPTGLFSRPTSPIGDGAPENLVYDSVSGTYNILAGGPAATTFYLLQGNSLAGTWTNSVSIIGRGVAGTWDSQYISGSHLFKNGATWYLYYSGTTNVASTNWCIGYATASSLLGPYTKFAGNPVLTNSQVAGAWDATGVIEPFVTQIGNTWYMFYCGVRTSSGSPYEQIGYATSTSADGPWATYSGNPAIVFGAPFSSDEWTVADPYVCGPYHGWYYIGYSSGVTLSAPWCHSMAQTRDFVHFYKVGNIYANGVGAEWDITDAHKGALATFTNVHYLTYCGVTGATYSNSIATMSAVSTATGFDPNQVFHYYDDFSGVSRDANRWGVSLSGGFDTVSAGIMTVNSGTNTVRKLLGRRLFGVNKMAEFLCRHTSFAGVSQNYSASLGLINNAGDRFLRIFDYNNAKWQYGIGAAAGNMADDASANWVTQRVYLQTSTLGLFQNDNSPWEAVAVPANFTNAIPVGMQSYSKPATGATNVFDVDYILVREYRTNEPTATFGSIETKF